MRKIGLVFEGGGGKGAYQIGAWKAIRELGIEKHICMISGTSVGALNAALFCQGSLIMAENIWGMICEDDILHIKENDDYFQGNCFFSQKKLESIISKVLQIPSRNDVIQKCFVTCKCDAENMVRYFEWSKYMDIELKKKILLASSAIPIIFESVKIDGRFYSDGGLNGDNIPVKPLLNQGLDSIIVIHLSRKPVNIYGNVEKVYEVFPSVGLGDLLIGTLDFDKEHIQNIIQLGYVDTLKNLRMLGEELLELYDELENVQRETKRIYFHKEKIKFTYSKGETDLAEFNFSNEEVKKMYEKKLQDLKKLADTKVDDTKYLWDITVRKYATKMETVKKLLASEGISEQVTAKMFKDIDAFLARCSNAEFHIALVGAIKAGKSTLINAILGYEYASTKVTPETASLTKFRKGQDNYVKVVFYSVDEWASLWKSANEAKATVFLEEYAKLNADSEKDMWLGQKEKMVLCNSKEELVDEIHKWTSSKSVCHYFVKEVEVGLKEFELPEGVVLVDTPGLDDVVEYRSNITRDYIDRANAVLVCVKSDALTGQEWATICSVFSNTRYNPEKVYIIATQLDTLNRPKENWKEQQAEWVKYLKGNSAFASQELARKNLIAVSAYLYTLLKSYNSLSEDDDKTWDLESILMKLRVKNINEQYQNLLDFTNIDLLKRRIQKDIVQNYKKLLVEDISASYELCRESIKEAMEKIKKSQMEIIKVSQGGLEDIQKKQQEYTKKYEEAEKDKKELDAMLKKLKMTTTQRASELEKAIKNLNGSSISTNVAVHSGYWKK